MTTLSHIACPLDVKFAGGAPGEFEGYASVFNGLDSYGDKIAPGAFRDTLSSLKTSGRNLPMYMQHGGVLGADPRPVGVWTSLSEDGRGLKVAGRLVALETETGRYNHALVKDGAMRGLSIGYHVPPGGAEIGAGGAHKRTLKRVDLREISIVDDPADPHALITSVKLDTQVDLERLLRASGLARGAAAKIAAGGFSALHGRGGDADPGLDRIASMLDLSLADLKNSKG